MAISVIDKLIVELGLDPRQFKKGTKEAQDDAKKFEGTVTSGAKDMVGALQRVAAEFVGLFLTVRGIHGVVGFFSDLNAATRQLGIDSRNTGESAAHLRDWGNIAEMAGGQADDALKSISQLQQSIFSAHQGFGWNDQLTNFLRLGVQFQDATGHMRDFHDILLDTSRALSHMSQPDRFQWTQKLGLQGGIANAVTEGPDQIEKYWQQQLKIHQTTDADTRAAAQLGQAWDLLKDKMRALTTQILTAVSPAVQRLFGAMGGFLSKHQGDVTHGVDAIADWAAGPGPGKVIDALEQMAEAAVTVAKAINDAATWITHPGDKVRSMLQGSVDKDKADLEKMRAASSAGIPQNILLDARLPQDLDNPAYEAQMLKRAHELEGGDTGDPTWIKAINRFNQGLRRTPAPNALKANQGAGAAGAATSSAIKSGQGTVPASGAAAGGGPLASNSSTTNIHIDKITVTTAATDADGVASGIDGALQRKLTASLADGGLS